MSTLEDTPSTDTLYRFVREVLLACSQSDFKKRVTDVFEELDKNVRQLCEVDNAADLEERLRSCPQPFHFSSEDVNDLPTVALTTTLNWCEAHRARGGSCRDRACAGLHFCLFFLLSGKCPYGKGCHFGHDLGSGHNVRVLRGHGLEGLDVGELGSLLALPWVRRGVACPQVCRHYNSIKGCKKKDECRYLHLCKFYVTGECKFDSSCKRIHELDHPQVTQVLELYGVETEGRQDADVLKEVTIYDSSPRDETNGSAVASFLRYLGGPPGIHHGSTIAGPPLFAGRSEDKKRLDHHGPASSPPGIHHHGPASSPPGIHHHGPALSPPGIHHHGPASSPPGIHSRRTSRQSDCLEDGEIRDDLWETSSLSEDDSDSTCPDVARSPKDARGRGKSPESSWRMYDVNGRDTSRMSEYGEEMDRRGKPGWISKRSGNETWYGSSGMSDDDNINHEVRRWSEDYRSMRASRQISGDSRRRDGSPQRISLGDSRRRDDSPQRISLRDIRRRDGSPQRISLGDSRRRDGSPQRIYLSPQRPEDDWTWIDSSPRSFGRHHSQRRSHERREEYNSLQMPDDGGRKYSPGRRYGSPDKSKDVRGSYDSLLMSERRRRDSSPMSSRRRCNSPPTSSRRRQESRTTRSTEYFYSQRANDHRTRGYSPQAFDKRPYGSPSMSANYMRHSEETRFEPQASRRSGANGIPENAQRMLQLLAHRRRRKDNSRNSLSDSIDTGRPLMAMPRVDRQLRPVSPPHRATFPAGNEETDALLPFTGFPERIDSTAIGRRSPGGKIRGRRSHPAKSWRPYQHPGSRRQRQFVNREMSSSRGGGNERQRKR